MEKMSKFICKLENILMWSERLSQGEMRANLGTMFCRKQNAIFEMI